MCGVQWSYSPLATKIMSAKPPTGGSYQIPCDLCGGTGHEFEPPLDTQLDTLMENASEVVIAPKCLASADMYNGT